MFAIIRSSAWTISNIMFADNCACPVPCCHPESSMTWMDDEHQAPINAFMLIANYKSGLRRPKTLNLRQKRGNVARHKENSL